MNVPTVITPPAAEPITLPEAKAHLRVIGTDDDALVVMMTRLVVLPLIS